MEKAQLLLVVPDLLIMILTGLQLAGTDLAATCSQNFSSRPTAIGVRYDLGSTDCRRCLRLACDWNGDDGTRYLVDVG